MRWRIDRARAVALVLVVVLFVVGFAGNRAIAFVVARCDPSTSYFLLRHPDDADAAWTLRGSEWFRAKRDRRP